MTILVIKITMIATINVITLNYECVLHVKGFKSYYNLLFVVVAVVIIKLFRV